MIRILPTQKNAARNLGRFSLTDAAAERRVDEAIWLCTDGRIALQAKGAGRLDQFRASILAEELRDADTDTTQAVLANVDNTLGTETAGPLRRRVRRVINKVDPHVLRLKAARARGDRRLERWAGEPGMDHWLAVLPADQAGPAYAAINARAHERVTEGLNETIDNARADALLELILGHCVGSISVQLAVPTTTLLEHAVTAAEAATLDPSELINVEGLSSTGPVQLRRSSLQALLDHLMAALTGDSAYESEDRKATPRNEIDATLVGCDPTTGARTTAPLDPSKRANSPQLSSQAHDAPAALRALVTARDPHCRFPGCTINARFCDLDHVIPWPLGPTTATNLICLCRRHHRIKQREQWSVRLMPDGCTIWTDPAGRQRTTHPIDHLDLAPINTTAKPLPSNQIDPGAPTEIPFRRARPRPPEPGIPDRYETSPEYFSHVEYALEHLLAEAESITRRAATETPEPTAEPPPF